MINLNGLAMYVTRPYIIKRVLVGTVLVKFSCSKCKKDFDRKENFMRHEKVCSVKKKKSSTCTICLKEFRSQWFLKRHLKTHSNKKSTKCQNCGQWLQCEDAKQHTLICQAEKPISASELDDEFVTMVPISRYFKTIYF